MPAQNVVLRHPDGRDEPRVVVVPDELDLGHSFTLEGAEWAVVSKEPDPNSGASSSSVLVCERRST